MIARKSQSLSGVSMCVCVYVYVSGYLSPRLTESVYVCTCACVHVCMCVCVYVREAIPHSRSAGTTPCRVTPRGEKEGGN